MSDDKTTWTFEDTLRAVQSVSDEQAEKMQAAPGITLAKITLSRDIETVKAAIRDKYGFEVSTEYARDLIAFVEQMAMAKDS